MTHLLLPCVLLLAAAAPAGFDDVALVKSRGKLLFADDFNRDEKSPDKEDIGNGWTSNSATRAKGHKQVDLDGGVMKVMRHAAADHGVAIFHDVAFQDGAVQLRFKIGEGDTLAVDFVDREYKQVHAGHLCNARVSLQGVVLTDSKTGGMDNKNRERRLAGDKSPEFQKLLKSKQKNIAHPIDAAAWHEMLVVVEGEEMRVTVDGKPLGRFRSEGMAHPTKRMITLAVAKSAWVDDVKVWRLK